MYPKMHLKIVFCQEGCTPVLLGASDHCANAGHERNQGMYCGADVTKTPTFECTLVYTEFPAKLRIWQEGLRISPPSIQALCLHNDCSLQSV